MEISDERDFVIELVIFACNQKRGECDQLELLLMEGVFVHSDIKIGNGYMDDEGALLELVTELINPVDEHFSVLKLV